MVKQVTYNVFFMHLLTRLNHSFARTPFANGPKLGKTSGMRTLRLSGTKVG